jgi:MFS family permease
VTVLAPPLSAEQLERRRRRQAIAVGAGLYALSGPGQTAGFSVFVDPLTEAFGISRSGLTAAYLIATLAAAPTGIWIGRQIDHRRTSFMIRAVSIGLAAALLVSAAAPVLVILVLGVFGLRAFGQSGLTLTSTTFVARAISERRGAALGALSAFGGFAIALTPLVASRMIPHIGWRSTWVVLAVTVAGVGWAVSRTSSANATAPAELPRDPANTPLQPVKLTREQRWGFLVVAAGFGTTAAISTALVFHQIAVLGERGLTSTQAATNFLPQSLAAASTAIVVGRLVDRLPGRVVVPANMIMLTLAMLSLGLVGSATTAIVFGIALGVAAAATGASEGALLARWLGTDQLGSIRGRLMAVVVTASAVGPLAFSLLTNAVGSFTLAAAIATVIPLTVVALTLAAPLPADRSL